MMKYNKIVSTLTFLTAYILMIYYMWAADVGHSIFWLVVMMYTDLADRINENKNNNNKQI